MIESDASDSIMVFLGMTAVATYGAFGTCRSEYDVRDHTLIPGLSTSLTSILRVRLSGSADRRRFRWTCGWWQPRTGI